MSTELFLVIVALLALGTVLQIAGLYIYTLLLMKQAPKYQARMMKAMVESENDFDDDMKHVPDLIEHHTKR